MGTTLYRGEPVARLNENEFRNGLIETAGVDIWEVVHATEDELQLDDRQAFFGTDREDLPFPTDSYTQEFTAGFTDHIGAAVFFSWYDHHEPGIVLSFDSSAIPDIEPVEYELDYMNRNPGILARIETLADGEIRWGGEVIGLHNGGSASRWRPDMPSRVDNKTYIEESEWWTPSTSVPVRSGLQSVVSYVETGHGDGEIEYVLSNMEGYYVGYGDGHTDAKFLDTDEQIMAYYDALSDEMNDYEDKLTVVLLDTDGAGNDVRKSTENLRDKFLMAYDGDRLIESASAASQWLGDA